MNEVCFLGLTVFFVLILTSFGNEEEKARLEDLRFLSASEEINDLSELYLNTGRSCDCGENGNCTFVRGKKTCSCDHGYAEKRKTCKPCDCGSSGSCSFIRGHKICKCNEGFGVKDGRCTACECGMNERCLFYFGKQNCVCKEGYTEYNGTCTECSCGDGGDHCYFSEPNKTKKCSCSRGYSVYRESFYPYEETCEACRCGGLFDRKKCSFVRGVKTCTCEDGYTELLGICHECDCGGNGTCELFRGSTSDKVCSCNEGFKEFNGKCQECDCGPHSISCRLGDDDRNQCTCKGGYSSRYSAAHEGELCERCDCGEDGRCEYVDNHKKCFCDSGYFEIRGKCQECDCGEYSVFCKNESGAKKCTCKKGYFAFQELHEDSNDEYCRDVFEKVATTSGWHIAVYVLAFLVAINMILSLIVIAKSRKVRRRPKEINW